MGDVPIPDCVDVGTGLLLGRGQQLPGPIFAWLSASAPPDAEADRYQISTPTALMPLRYLLVIHWLERGPTCLVAYVS